MSKNISWKRIDMPGLETARLLHHRGWMLSGHAEFEDQGAVASLNYEIQCGEDWLTLSAAVVGAVRDHEIDLEILRNSAGEWSVNGGKVWEVTGCDDIDLNFSPSTNMLPIRRLNLAIGQSASVRAAWLRFPSFALEPFEQTYTRLAEDRYRYESADGKFHRELTVDPEGFVLDYPGLWHAETA